MVSLNTQDIGHMRDASGHSLSDPGWDSTELLTHFLLKGHVFARVIVEARPPQTALGH